ncbi:hypothetical protein [Mesoflavibacter sp. CH_XMU1404-2]|uniref:hypothetical protein n=1 Tax=Mesoflavibacter sp. CH_XMU1404-2 TaxID=3107766 RepID=UPI00243FEA63
MKTYTIILITIFLNACGATKNMQSDLAENSTETSTMSKTNQTENMIFEYTAITRGSYTMVKANKDTITYQLSRASKEETKDCTKQNWDTLTNLASNVDITKIDQLEAPSKAHQYDGAAIANLNVTVGDKTYRTQSFDAGNPPKEIAEIVNYLLSLTPKN